MYLSRTNNTKAIAEFIHQKVDGTMVALEIGNTLSRRLQRDRAAGRPGEETGYLPLLKTKIERIEQYDVVFLGFPTWGMQLPPKVKSLLRQYSLNGKTVIPFNTNADTAKEAVFERLGTLSAAQKPWIAPIPGTTNCIDWKKILARLMWN